MLKKLKSGFFFSEGYRHKLLRSNVRPPERAYCNIIKLCFETARNCDIIHFSFSGEYFAYNVSQYLRYMLSQL